MDQTINDTVALLPLLVVKRGAASILSLFINVPGLIAHGLVCYIFIKYQKQFSNSFYTLALSLSISDCLTGILELIYCIPARLIDEQRIAYGYQNFIGFLSVGSWFMIISHMTVITFNRLVAVVFYKKYATLFSVGRVALLITGCYIYGLLMATVMYTGQCKAKFPSYAWLWECTNSTSAKVALTINQVVSNGAMIVIGVCHIVIFIQVRRKGRKVKSTVNTDTTESQSRKELKLMIQFSAISSALLAYEATFWIIPPLIESGRLSDTVGAIVINTFCNLNSCISPFLYLAFSSEIRQRLACCSRGAVAALGSGLASRDILSTAVTYTVKVYDVEHSAPTISNS